MSITFKGKDYYPMNASGVVINTGETPRTLRFLLEGHGNLYWVDKNSITHNALKLLQKIKIGDTMKFKYILELSDIYNHYYIVSINDISILKGPDPPFYFWDWFTAGKQKVD